jgi:hypothetical protein
MRPSLRAASGTTSSRSCAGAEPPPEFAPAVPSECPPYDKTRDFPGTPVVHTGPTGTNVGDLVLGLKLSRRDARLLAERHGGLRPRVL